MLPYLPLLERLEVFTITTTAVMQRVVEAVAQAPAMAVLSLPQLAVQDEALLLLWGLLQQRSDMVAGETERVERSQAMSTDAEKAVLKHVERQEKQRSRKKAMAHGGGGGRVPSFTTTTTSSSSLTLATKQDGRSVGTTTTTTATTRTTTGTGSEHGGRGWHHSTGSRVRRRLCEDKDTVVEGEGVGGGDDDDDEGRPPPALPYKGVDVALPPPSSQWRRLEIPILDLSHCQIDDPMTVKKICCPGVQVLFLAGLANAVTDTALHCVLKSGCPTLHTMDLSGCTRLTSEGLQRYVNRHDHVLVLRVEHCPQIHTLHLDHVQVLYSPLNYIRSLRMPSLRRLPIPVESRAVLRDFCVPELEEISFHRIMIDRLTFPPALLFTEEELRRIHAYERDQYLAKECQRDALRIRRTMEEEQRTLQQEKVSTDPTGTAVGSGDGGPPPSVLPSRKKSVERTGVPTTAPSSITTLSTTTEEEEEEGRGEESLSTSTPLLPVSNAQVLAIVQGILGVPATDAVEDADGGPPRARSSSRRAASTSVRLALPPRLKSIAFIQCDFTDPVALPALLTQQEQLMRLTVHRCTGVEDACLRTLPKTLRYLDVAYCGSLSDVGLQYLVTQSPLLVHLNLKQAGGHHGIGKEGIHALYGLPWLQHLNLLGLSPETVQGSVVSALAASLPHLTTLYHETAVVPIGREKRGGATAEPLPPPPPPSFDMADLETPAGRGGGLSLVSTSSASPTSFLSRVPAHRREGAAAAAPPVLDHHHHPSTAASSYLSTTTTTTSSSSSYLHVYRTDHESVWMKQLATVPLQSTFVEGETAVHSSLQHGAHVGE